MEFNIDLVAGLLGLTPEKITESLQTENEKGEKTTLEGDALAQKLKELSEERNNDILSVGEKAGARKRMTEFEKNIREKYKIQQNTQGEALIDVLVKGYEDQINDLKKQLGEGKKPPEMDEEKAKAFIINHPYFQERENQYQAAINAEKANFEAFKKEIEGREIKNAVKSFASDYLKNQYRAVLPDDPTIAETQVNAFLDHVLVGATWKKEGEALQPFDQNGEPITVEYKKVDAPGFVSLIAKQWFKQHPADPSKNTPGAGDGKGVNIPDFRGMSENEVYKIVLNEKDPVKNAALLEEAKKYLNSIK